LTSVTIPKNVTSIEFMAFEGCKNLTILGKKGSFAEEYAINTNIPFAVSDDFQCSISNGYATITGYSGSDMSITIPSTLGGYPVTNIGDSAFANSTELSGVNIGNGVTSIGNNAFENCDGLTIVPIPENITNIGDGAFYGCDNLEKASFLGNAPKMGSNVFDNTDKSFKVHYVSGKSGFTNPWNGYETTSYDGPPVLLIVAGVVAIVVVASVLIRLLFLRKKRK